VELLRWVGENPDRDGLLRTPERYLKSLRDLTSGYDMEPANVLGVQFDMEHDIGADGGLVLCKDIELYSLCEHHMLPFFGKAHVGYIPQGNRVVGLSKLARLVDIYARRLQVQERLTHQVMEAIVKHLEPVGVMVVVEATHLCMRMRGVAKQNSTMVTSAVHGAFKHDAAARSEFMALVGR
jgi:GTP cyclohydrolase I